MLKRIPFLLLALSLSSISYAQRTADIAYSTGMVHYIGDLANERHFPMSSANIGMQVTIRDFLNNPQKSHALYKPFGVELRFSWHRLQYDETKPLNGKAGMQLRNYLRGISFRNDLFGTMVNFTYTNYANKYKPLHKQRLAYFLLAGVGAFYGAPTADLFKGKADIKNRYYFWKDGTIHDVSEKSGQTGNIVEKDGEYETNLHDWRTEGQGYESESNSKKPYSVVNIGFPLGAGIRYGVNKNITMSAEFNYYYFFTDYLDDVSGRYATFDELAATFPNPEKYEMAKYITDPTGFGSSGEIDIATSPRGNPKMKDSFTYISLEVAYKFTVRGKGVYGQFAKN